MCGLNVVDSGLGPLAAYFGLCQELFCCTTDGKFPNHVSDYRRPKDDPAA
jgi:hypothetical protein